MAATALGALADAADVLVLFAKTGPDVYADGRPVLDREWYALVWSQDGVFEGINIDCTPTDPDDRVVLMAPLAEDGHCPSTIFYIDSKVAKAMEGGVYAVYQLDTRTADKTSVAADVGGRPSEVNAAVALQSYAAGGALDCCVTSKSFADTSMWASSTIDVTSPEFRQPKIEEFQVADGNVRITVSSMMPGVKYNVLMGESVDRLESYALEVPKTRADGEDVVFEVMPAEARFFKVTREPLVR